MSTKTYTATLVGSETYSIVTKSFVKGVPVTVNEKEASILSSEQRSFQDPQTKETHIVKLFKIEEVSAEQTQESGEQAPAGRQRVAASDQA